MGGTREWWVAVTNGRDNIASGSLRFQELTISTGQRPTWFALCEGPFPSESKAWEQARRLQDELHDVLVQGGRARDLWTTEEHQPLTGIVFQALSSDDLASAQEHGVRIAGKTTLREVFEATLGRRLPTWPPYPVRS